MGWERRRQLVLNYPSAALGAFLRCNVRALPRGFEGALRAEIRASPLRSGLRAYHLLLTYNWRNFLTAGSSGYLNHVATLSTPPSWTMR